MHSHQLPVGCQHAILGALGAGGTTGHDLHRLGAADGLLLHESTVFARHQHDLADLRALVKSADAAVQHRFAAQVKAELVEPHPGEEPAATSTAEIVFCNLHTCPCCRRAGVSGCDWL